MYRALSYNTSELWINRAEDGSISAPDGDYGRGKIVFWWSSTCPSRDTTNERGATALSSAHLAEDCFIDWVCVYWWIQLQLIRCGALSITLVSVPHTEPTSCEWAKGMWSYKSSESVKPARGTHHVTLALSDKESQHVCVACRSPHGK